ncbi:MAG TPA: A/G-specific adenine glycosylase [Flavobacteriales bacterium]|nr:A/G-specific adenine glycosylase [Flavobacteriales bacterium]
MSTTWFSRALLPWYREHKRPLPWRASRDPYRIWLSEVILQQTRVDQGTAYWHRFVEHYPLVQDLAGASEDEVLRLWQGLGYYSRARNLRTAARQVVERHQGRFPADHGALLALKGVGDYTAAAIGSMAFGLAEPVVDGNVYRVLARVFGIATPIDSTAGRKEFRALAASLLPTDEPGEYNQAVMELGALVCTPKPACEECPLRSRCIARRTDRITELPVKAGRTKVRERHFNFLHIRVRGGVFLEKRTGKDIWQGLYQLPLLESDEPLSRRGLQTRLKAELGIGWTIEAVHGPVKHVLSHQLIQGVFWALTPPPRFKAQADWLVANEKELERYALPRLVERYLLP